VEHFPSKVDTWLRVVLSLSAVLCFATAIWYLRLPEAEQMTWPTVTLLLAGGLCLWIMTTTYYRVYVRLCANSQRSISLALTHKQYWLCAGKP